MSASCTHVSALLHALVAATFIEFTIRPTSLVSNLEDLPVTFANGKLLKDANRAPFASLILCLKNLYMARWRKGSWNPWKILIPVLISSKAQWKILFQLYWTTSVGRDCAFLFCLTPICVLTMAQHCLRHPFQLKYPTRYWEAEEISFSLQGKSK